MPATENQTRKTLEPSRALTSAQRSSNILHQMRWPYATLPLWLCPLSSTKPRESMTSVVCTKSTQVVTRNLNKIIDLNYYPVPEAKKSNFRHRPIGLGVQGLADAFLALRLPFDSPEAKQLNIQIFETIYHAALTASCETCEGARSLRDLSRIAYLKRHPTVRHVECHTHRPLGLGFIEG